MVKSTIDDLLGNNLISIDQTGTYKASLLGQAIVTSSLSPDDGIFVHEEIQRALRAFVMDGEMHIFYMFTPIQTTALADINWRIFRSEMERLDESGLRAMAYVGINPKFVNEMSVTPNPKNPHNLPHPSQIRELSTDLPTAGATAANRSPPAPPPNSPPRASTTASTPPSNCATSATKCPSTPSRSNTIPRAATCRTWRKPVTVSPRA